MNAIGRKPAHTVAELASARQHQKPSRPAWSARWRVRPHGSLVQESGCGVTSRPVRRCYRNRGGLLRKQKARRECDALRAQTTGPKGMRSYTTQWPCVVVVIVGNRQKAESDERMRDSMVRLVFCLWLAESGFTLSQRQATSKSASTFLSACRLLPRLEEVYIPWVHCLQSPRFARIRDLEGTKYLTIANRERGRLVDRLFNLDCQSAGIGPDHRHAR